MYSILSIVAVHFGVIGTRSLLFEVATNRANGFNLEFRDAFPVCNGEMGGAVEHVSEFVYLALASVVLLDS